MNNSAFGDAINAIVSTGRNAPTTISVPRIGQFRMWLKLDNSTFEIVDEEIPLTVISGQKPTGNRNLIEANRR